MGEVRFFELPPGVPGPERIAVIKQEDKEGCAAASLYALLHTLNIEVEYKQLYDELGTTKDGVGDTSKITQALTKRHVDFQELTVSKSIDLNKILDNDCLYYAHIQAPNSDYEQKYLTSEDREHVGRSKNHGHYVLVFVVEKDRFGKILRLLIMDSLIDKGETRYGEGIKAMSLEWFFKRFIDVDTKEGWMLRVPKVQPAEGEQNEV